MLEGDEYGISEDDVTGVVSFLAGPDKLSNVIKFYFSEIIFFVLYVLTRWKNFLKIFKVSKMRSMWMDKQSQSAVDMLSNNDQNYKLLQVFSQ